MPERWERDLQKIRTVDVRERDVRERVDRGPIGHRVPARRDRLVAGVVAAVVFVAAGAFAWRAFTPAASERDVDVPNAEPQPTSTDSVVVDIRRTSPETGDPEAIARSDGQEQWMCPDGWNLVNPDGTTGSVVFECGQDDLFQAAPGTPIEVTGDFETINITTAVRNGSEAAPADRVAALEPGSVVTYAYEVTWEDGSEASFWLLLTVEGEQPASGSGEEELVIRIHALGERSTEIPTVTATYGGETRRGCTQALGWDLPDGTRLDEAVGRPGSVLVPCSSDPLFRVAPGIPIVVIADTATDVVVSRTTTPFYGGPDSVGASVRWPEGKGAFLVPFEVVATGDAPRAVDLACAPGDRIPFGPPDGGVILPGGSLFITGNIVGFLPLDVVEQMTRNPDGDTEWSGIWQVVRNGQVIASVDWDALSGTACRGSGIGGA